MNKKKKKATILISLIVAISILDAGSQAISNVLPVVGQILSTFSNGLYEVMQVILGIGLYKTVVD